MLSKNLNLPHKLAECILACNNCHNACLDEEHVKMMKECIKLDKECAEICSAALMQVYAGGHYIKEILSLCEKACTACAAECGKYPDEHCRKCAKVCNECAEACRDFS